MESLQRSLTAFSAWCEEHITGDEKGEAQLFCDRFFQALGHGGVKEAGASFEFRLKKQDSRGTAFADLMWKPRCLIEMKRSGTNLSRHYRQAFQYWVHAVPERPRYVILCNFTEFWIYDFDKQLDAPVEVVALADLAARWEALAFLLPEPREPVFGNDLVAVTRQAAMSVTAVFRSLTERGIGARHAQRFILQCVVAMFSEDIGLLPARFFSRALEDAWRDQGDAFDLLGGLFAAMNTAGTTAGGRYAGTPYFNGGLFSKVEPISLALEEVGLLRSAAGHDWSAVRPEIFGTLFETSMDAGERHAAGAHYTSQADIAKVVLPTIVEPWQHRIEEASSIAQLERLLLEMSTFRVLDPACGSGNFLYVAYREMRRLEAEVKHLINERRKSTDIAAQGTLSLVTPDHFLGLDNNPFAVEVAKVTMMMGKKLAADELGEEQGVLPLDNLDDTIRAADALFTPWPKADVIIGNPPYLGRRKMVEELGLEYAQRLAERFPLVGGVSDFVTYWFPLAHDALPIGGYAGFVATQGVRVGASRKASLDYITDHDGVIFDAVSSQPWSGDAAVTVAIVNWVKGTAFAPEKKTLWLDNGQLRLLVNEIPGSLKPDTDVATAVSLTCNKSPKVCFQGQTSGMVESFRLDWDSAKSLVSQDGRSKAVIHPVIGGEGLLHQLAPSLYVIDIPFDDALEARIEAPGAFAHLEREVLPSRVAAASRKAAATAANEAKRPKHHQNFLNKWWKQAYRREDMLARLGQVDRYLALSRVAAEGRKSVWQFVHSAVRPDDSLQVVALADDFTFGVLSSQLHRDWLNARCSRLETRPRYTSTTVFDSFPWLASPSESAVTTVTDIAAEIVNLRETYLHRGVTLGEQYDVLRRPGRSRLGTLHSRLDEAVEHLYELKSGDDPLAHLLALNLAGAAEPGLLQRPGGDSLAGTRVTDYRVEAVPLWD